MGSRFSVAVGYPPDEPSKIAELIASAGKGKVEAPAVVYRTERGELVLRLYSRTGEIAFEYPASDFQEALAEAIGLFEES